MTRSLAFFSARFTTLAWNLQFRCEPLMASYCSGDRGACSFAADRVAQGGFCTHSGQRIEQRASRVGTTMSLEQCCSSR